MAILGFQLVSTLIGVSLLSKITAHFSFTSALVFGGIYRYIIPSDKEILESAGLTKTKSKGKRINSAAGVGEDRSELDSFHFPRATTVKLRTAEVHARDIAAIPFYTELVWLVDFSVCAMAVLFINDLVCFLRQILSSSNNETKSSFLISVNSFFASSTINLNLVWSLFVVWFAVSSLFSVLRVYFNCTRDTKDKVKQGSLNNSEWPLLMVAAFSSFVAAMLCLSFDVHFLDLRISLAYGNFSLSAASNVAARGSVVSWGMFQAVLALFAAIIGTMFTFPGLQYGRVYMQALQSLQESSSSWATRLLFHINFIAPQIALFLWVVPLTARLPARLMQHATSGFEGALGSIWSSGLVACAQVFTSERICSLRLVFTLLTVLLRVAMTKKHMQAFLDTAQARLNSLTREPGRISNIEVQRIVASVFHCFNFAAIQYLAPAILLFGLVCSFKDSTGIGWLPIGQSQSPTVTPAGGASPSLQSVLEAFAGQDWESIFTAPWFTTLQQTRVAFAELWESVRIQAGHVCQGVFGFAIFWCLLAWQAVATTGMAYYRFID